MAITVQNAGLTLVKIATTAAQTLVDLGYTRNGVDVTTQPYFIDVPGDANGGDQGPPIDIQYLGEIAHIRLELTSWDSAVLDTIKARIPGGTAGTPGTVGTFAFQGNVHYRVVLSNPNLPRNFPRVMFREPIQKNFGTRFAMVVLEGIAYKNGSGVLYNTTIT